MTLECFLKDIRFNLEKMANQQVQLLSKKQYGASCSTLNIENGILKIGNSNLYTIELFSSETGKLSIPLGLVLNRQRYLDLYKKVGFICNMDLPKKEGIEEFLNTKVSIKKYKKLMKKTEKRKGFHSAVSFFSYLEEKGLKIQITNFHGFGGHGRPLSIVKQPEELIKRKEINRERKNLLADIASCRYELERAMAAYDNFKKNELIKNLGSSFK